MQRITQLLALLSFPAFAFAQSVTPGDTALVTAEAANLFAATNNLTINSASFTANKVTNICGGNAAEVQFGVGRGYLGANGFVISNAWVENQDQENPPTLMTDDPTACADFQGSVAGLPGPGLCEGADPTLAAAVMSLSGVPVGTEDAASLTIDFDAASATILDLSYSVATFELPTDATFFDSFGIFLDGALVAGGTTNGVPPTGTDPWSFSPSTGSPSEFNSMPVNAFFAVPANTTGLRTVELALTAGNHVLEFHVADSSDTIADTTCQTSSDNVVDTSLFVGLHTYQSGNPGAVTPGFDIGRIGHPTETGGPFGDDFQLSLSGAQADTLLIIIRSPSSMPGLVIPLLAPNEILLGSAQFNVLSKQMATETGFDVYPDVPAPIPVGLTGTRYFYQWWGLNAGVFSASKGMALTF